MDRYCLDRSLYEDHHDEFIRFMNPDAYLDAEPFPETRYVLERFRS